MKNKISITLKPFTFLFSSSKTNSLFVLFFLLPQIFMLFLTKSWSNLLIILLTTIAGLGAEFFEKLYKKDKTEYHFILAIIQGLLTGLFLPASYPLVSAFFITFFVTITARFFIGGFADNWINIPCLAVCVCWLTGAAFFPDYQITHEILLSKNPALSLIQNGTFPMNAFDSRITASLNRTVFSFFGVSIPDGYISLFWDSSSVIPAFRFNFITLVTSIILISLDVIKAFIPAVFILVYSLLIYFVSPYFYDSTIHGDLLLGLCTSGLLTATLFLLQFAGTTPLTLTGKLVYAILAGISAFLIIGAGTSPAGAVFTILCMNVISLFIQHIEHIVELHRTKTLLYARIKEMEEA